MNDLATLVNRARAGEPDSFAAIVRRFQDMAVGYGFSLIGDFHLAEDAAQEAFLEAYLKLSNLREPAAFPGWFRRIVFKQCDRITRGRKVILEELDAAAEATDRNPDIPMMLERTEMTDAVLAAVNSLSEHERTAISMFYISGHTQQEVSDFLDVPVSTVKKRLYSARRHLHDMLADSLAHTFREHRPSRDEAFSATVMDLLSAARAGDVKRVQQLLKSNQRLLTARDWLGNSALVMAVNSGQLSVAELLFKAGVQPDIHEAAAIGQTARVAELLREAPDNLNRYSNEGFPPLTLAVHFGHVETTTYLLEKGADPSIVSLHPLQVTPLHAALFGNQIETARLLIEHGADVSARRGGKGWPRGGWTALHYVAGYGFLELIHPLISRQANINAIDDEGKTPLRVAIENDESAVAATLRDLGARE